MSIIRKNNNMKNEIRPFLKEYENREKYIGCIRDRDAIEDVPEIEGVYIIASKEQKFIYPNGESAIIYIGKSVNLRARLLEHHRLSEAMFNSRKDELNGDWYYSRYQYIRKFGGKIFYITRRGTQDGKDLEMDIIEKLYDRYLSLPVGNGAFSFGK